MRSRRVQRSRRDRARRRRLEDGGSESTEANIGHEQNLQVAYVNVQGLDTLTWDKLLTYMGPGKLDLVFIAETWYVGYDGYRTAPCTVAHTPRPPTKNGSRYTGGICLVASARARTLISEPAVATVSTISIRIGQSTIAGVYLPPAMGGMAMEEALEAVGEADVVMGDINVRYNERTGMATPRDRGTLIAAWAQRHDLFRLDPKATKPPLQCVILAPSLTVDHCFARRKHVTEALHLLSNSSLGLVTDHIYTLLIGLSNIPLTRHSNPKLPRYRIARLDSPAVRERMVQRWVQTASVTGSDVPWHGDVDQLNGKIVALCQDCCQHVLGEISDNRGGQAPKAVDYEAPYFQQVRQIFGLDDQNGPLFSSDPLLDGLDEAAKVLGARYRAPPDEVNIPQLQGLGDERPLPVFTVEEIKQAIRDQDGSKACGADGVHMRALKALVDTSMTILLTALYNACLEHKKTPKVWNQTEIQLILKDPSEVKTIYNARPIALICMFRKVFESSLLKRLQPLPCLRLHPAQAGFRANYSTLTLASTVHIALEQRLCRGVIFLDFSAAFDMANHRLIKQALEKRMCSKQVIDILDALQAEQCSRVLANGGASYWFPRTRGILQGSPLSPLLWNLLVDDLLHVLNEGALGLPRGVFYADDGALLYTDLNEVQVMLGYVKEWCARNGIELNVRKCGHVTGDAEGGAYWGERMIPRVEEYKYLGFPVRASGVDFESHVERRMNAAVLRAGMMARHSDRWGVAHRLRAYREYLAPVIEYGAPLVWAWGSKSPDRWAHASVGWKELVQWIAHGKAAWRVSQNLLGLPSLEDRFETLHMTFLFDLQHSDPSNPLHILLFRPTVGGVFRKSLRESKLLTTWKGRVRPGLLDKGSMKRFQNDHLVSLVARQSQRSHLTALIPWECRIRMGPTYADGTLLAPYSMQDDFFQYRRGVWCFRYKHECEAVSRGFRRGDEECLCYNRALKLSRLDRARKAKQVAVCGGTGLFTNVDFLLNEHGWERAYSVLQHVRSILTAMLMEGEEGSA